MNALQQLKVKLFADGANTEEIASLARNPLISGFTTNPTLMRKAGVANYEAFAREVVTLVGDRPISFEVFADDFDEMERQASKIGQWGENVYVKIPITNCSAESAIPVARSLAAQGVHLNVTALTTAGQVEEATDALSEGPSAFISVFAGRIADTGRDPVPAMAEAVEILRPFPQLQLIWASPRELLNIFQADAIGCHVITATGDILNKLSLVGKDLIEYSRETVQMFYDDALAAGYALEVSELVRD
ncbi:MAG: transaldolase [Gaiellaceae bacterium]